MDGSEGALCPPSTLPPKAEGPLETSNFGLAVRTRHTQWIGLQRPFGLCWGVQGGKAPLVLRFTHAADKPPNAAE
jgi:hypothetical protein